MRMSVDRKDRGYHRRAHRFVTFLDGLFLERAITSDEELGQAVVLSVDAAGRGYRVPGSREAARHIVYGRIQIRRDRRRDYKRRALLAPLFAPRALDAKGVRGWNNTNKSRG